MVVPKHDSMDGEGDIVILPKGDVDPGLPTVNYYTLTIILKLSDTTIVPAASNFIISLTQGSTSYTVNCSSSNNSATASLTNGTYTITVDKLNYKQSKINVIINGANKTSTITLTREYHYNFNISFVSENENHSAADIADELYSETHYNHYLDIFPQNAQNLPVGPDGNYVAPASIYLADFTVFNNLFLEQETTVSYTLTFKPARVELRNTYSLPENYTFNCFPIANLDGTVGQPFQYNARISYVTPTPVEKNYTISVFDIDNNIISDSTVSINYPDTSTYTLTSEDNRYTITTYADSIKYSIFHQNYISTSGTLFAANPTITCKLEDIIIMVDINFCDSRDD